jgi:hypothetical protein
MVIIGFDDSETRKRALDYLNGRFLFRVDANGDVILTESALGPLAASGIQFRAKGLAVEPPRERPKVGEILSGEIKVDDSVFAPLTDEELKEWGL